MFRKEKIERQEDGEWGRYINREVMILYTPSLGGQYPPQPRYSGDLIPSAAEEKDTRRVGFAFQLILTTRFLTLTGTPTVY